MSDTNQKNKLLFNFYQNIKSGTKVLSVEDLALAIKTMELAKEELKLREQKRIQAAEPEAFKDKKQNDVPEKIVYLRSDLKHLPERAYEGRTDITKLVINKGLTEIGEYAFAGCENLKEIVFPHNRILLRRGSFFNCTSLVKIDIPDIANICPSAFENCISLEKIFLPWTISNIYSKAFKNCYLLEKVCFSDKVASGITIYSGAFENCLSLEVIEFPEHTAVDTESFINCAKLKEIHIKDNWVYQKKFKDCKAKVIKD